MKFSFWMDIVIHIILKRHHIEYSLPSIHVRKGTNMRYKVLAIFMALCFGAFGAVSAQAIDFSIKGRWQYSFMTGELNPIHKVRYGDGRKNSWSPRDEFGAVQRVRLQMDAAASENLSGSIFLYIGNQHWGRANQGGALGADGNMVKVRFAYIDWVVPDTSIKVRMGIQPIALPSKAGWTAVMDNRGPGITASWDINDNFGLTASWFRPSNDNYTNSEKPSLNNYLDNMDLFSMALPIKFDGLEFTPWAMYGMKGRNAFANGNNWSEGDETFTMRPYFGAPYNEYPINKTGKLYGDLFWFGTPIGITTFAPWNFEFDFNYGYVAPMGRYDAYKGVTRELKRGSTQRQGWIAKGLIEYKLDWATPGIFGWYGSGDDGNVKNGSERMPSITSYGDFSSFLGDGNLAWQWQDYNDNYSGCWGVGLQLKDISFINDLSHTVRAIWWGGTNSPSMVKYMDSSYAWIYGSLNYDGIYMTTNDNLLEFNVITDYQMYENFKIDFELDYVANFMDNDTWNKAGMRNTSFHKQDLWKAQVTFIYDF